MISRNRIISEFGTNVAKKQQERYAVFIPFGFAGFRFLLLSVIMMIGGDRPENGRSETDSDAQPKVPGM